MAYLILRILINALSIAVAVKVVNGITFTGEWWKMIAIGAVFGIVNSLIKPLLTLFTLPLIILTLGLFTLIINTLMLVITAELSGPFSLGLPDQWVLGRLQRCTHCQHCEYASFVDHRSEKDQVLQGLGQASNVTGL